MIFSRLVCKLHSLTPGLETINSQFPIPMFQAFEQIQELSSTTRRNSNAHRAFHSHYPAVLWAYHMVYYRHSLSITDSLEVWLILWPKLQPMAVKKQKSDSTRLLSRHGVPGIYVVLQIYPIQAIRR